MGVGRKKNPYIFAFVMRNGKIIVVDDNEAVLKTLRMILSREFKTVVCARCRLCYLLCFGKTMWMLSCWI